MNYSTIRITEYVSEMNYSTIRITEYVSEMNYSTIRITEYVSESVEELSLEIETIYSICS